MHFVGEEKEKTQVDMYEYKIRSKCGDNRKVYAIMDKWQFEDIQRKSTFINSCLYVISPNINYRNEEMFNVRRRCDEGSNFINCDIYGDEVTTIINLPTNPFVFTKFESNKSFDNLFIENKQTLINELDRFMHDKGHYQNLGIPHKLCIMMHGPPGCGKTSIIKSIARHTNRHIYNTCFESIKTNTELKSLFTYGTIKYDHFVIDPKNIVYVFEDIDINYKQLQTRQKNNNTEQHKNFMGPREKNMSGDPRDPFYMMEKIEERDKLNLATILNLFDGVQEMNNILIIMTTNKISELDDAFVRHGRMDMIMEIKKASCEIIQEIIKYMWNIDIVVDRIFDNIFTPSQLIYWCKDIDDIEMYIKLLMGEYVKIKNDEMKCCTQKLLDTNDCTIDTTVGDAIYEICDHDGMDVTNMMNGEMNEMNGMNAMSARMPPQMRSNFMCQSRFNCLPRCMPCGDINFEVSGGDYQGH